mgnify:CR=1 FL=1
MSFFDRFFKKSVRSGVFSFLFGQAAPDMKSGEFVNAYKGWVFACINAIADDTATLDLRLEKRVNKDEWQKVESHPALDLLRKVNSFNTFSDLIIATQSFLELEGDHFWYLVRGTNSQKILEIWPLDPTRMSVVKDDVAFVKGYVYHNEKGKEIPFDINEVLHFKRFNPHNPYRGLGTVQAAALEIDIDNFSGQWNKNFFYNSAMPSGVLEMDGTLTTEQYERLKAKWDAQHRGLENAQKLAILEGGLKFKPITMSQRDMDFLEQRKFSRDGILGIFRVPKAVIGITEDVNRANAEATEYVFAKRVIKPKMQFIVDRLNEFYLPLFGVNTSEMRFTYTDPVPRNLEYELQRKETGLRSGFYTINEVREEEGKEPLPYGDVVYFPVNLMPLGMTSASGGSATRDYEEKLDDQKPKKDIQTKDAEFSVDRRVVFIASEIDRTKGMFADIFLQQKSDYLRKLQYYKSVQKFSLQELEQGMFGDVTKWLVILSKPLTELLRSSVTYAGKEAIRQTGVSISFDMANPRVVTWLEVHALQSATEVNDTMKDEVRRILVEAVTSGKSITDIAGEISKFYEEQTEWRALRIARTEVIAGYNEGSLEGYRQSCVVKKKRWLTAQDDRVDEHCLKNERQGELNLESEFVSGGKAPPVHPNCRCTLLPIV